MKKIIGLMLILMAVAMPVEADIIVDSLGAATPSTQFSVFGTGGCANGIASTQFVGPEFTLTEPTVITEIGGFFVNCGFLLGVPQCPESTQFIVQIRPSTNGVPDPAIILASYPLSKNDNIFVATYQSVAINLPLDVGTYFALFAPLQDDMAGYVVGNATDPFLYQAEITPWGALDISTGHSSFHDACRNAVRILGIPLDTTPPVITVSANPAMLWPPNGKLVVVTVSGTITDSGGSGVNVSSTVYVVMDEYGQIQPRGSLTLGADGSYAFTMVLKASRKGNDQDGRHYTIAVSAEDNAGKLGVASTIVTVPHDQGK